MKRTVVAAVALALTGVVAPGSGPAGAQVVYDREHKLDAMIKIKGDTGWTGKHAYSQPLQQRVTGDLRRAPGKVVAIVRIVNRGTEATDVDMWVSSIRGAFYGGTHGRATKRTGWYRLRSGLAPGAHMQFRYVAHRGTARAGDTMPVNITLRHHNSRNIYDGVQLRLRAVGAG